MPLQPTPIVGPDGNPIIPQQMQGGMEPEMLGLPPGGDPMLFQQLMGNPPTPGELRDQLMPPEGM